MPVVKGHLSSTSNSKERQEAPSLRILAFGGLGEIGKNMLAVETKKSIVIIDAGIKFPRERLPWADFIIPDMSWIRSRSEKVKALLITHGHEDHIGAVPYLLSEMNVPVFASSMAQGIIRLRLKRKGIKPKNRRLNIVRDGEKIQLDDCQAEWFKVCHSIPGSMGIALDTPLGRIVHTGDFKIDHRPADGNPTDFLRMAEVMRDGVFVLLSDSTYAEHEGSSGSDASVAKAFHRIISQAPGRVIMATFASQIARLQMIIDAAVSCGRSTVLGGSSIKANSKIARELGLLKSPEGHLISFDEARTLPPEQVVIVVPGSQGEASSTLSRIAFGLYGQTRIEEGDTVIMSSSTIPGNEIAVQSVIDNLTRQGARVITRSSDTVHVRGHAQQDELRTILNMARPKYFVPIHGEYKMLQAHSELAHEQGILSENIFRIENGEVLELCQDEGRITERIDLQSVAVNGKREYVYEESAVDRIKAMFLSGVLFMMLVREKNSGRIIGEPELADAGFFHGPKNSKIIKDARYVLLNALEAINSDGLDWKETEQQLRQVLRAFVEERTGMRPLILSNTVEI